MSVVDLARFNAMPFAQLVGFEYVSASNGVATIRLPVTDAHANAQATGHGGLVPIIADACGTLAILSSLDSPDAVRLATVDLRVNFIQAARLGQVLTATGTAVLVEGRTSFARVEVVDGTGETIALAQLTCVSRVSSLTEGRRHPAGAS